MSRVKVNEITNKVATGPVDFPDGITGVALTVTGNVTVGGTIISEDTTNVDSVGWVTARSGLTVGPPSTGIGATIHANGNAVFAGIVTTGNLTAGSGTFSGAISGTTGTFTGDVDIADKIVHTGDTNTTIRFPAADTITAETAGNETIRVTSAGLVGIGTNNPGELLHLNTSSGNCKIRIDAAATPSLDFYEAGTRNSDIMVDHSSNNLIVTNRQNANIIFRTNGTNERLSITSSGGFNFSNGELIENCNVTAGKLSDNLTINLDNGMVHLFTTTETTTATPNIMSTAGINTSMSNGDAITVTLITTAAAGAYCANIQVDGAAVTENWIGGSAPSAGGSSGVDIHTFTIIKTASATFTVLGNQSKTS